MFSDEPSSEHHAEKNRLIHLLVESVTVREDGLDIVLKTNGLNSLVMELLTYAVEVEGRATA
jgi:site-specific DNA recombinase